MEQENQLDDKNNNLAKSKTFSSNFDDDFLNKVRKFSTKKKGKFQQFTNTQNPSSNILKSKSHNIEKKEKEEKEKEDIITNESNEENKTNNNMKQKRMSRAMERLKKREKRIKKMNQIKKIHYLNQLGLKI